MPFESWRACGPVEMTTMLSEMDLSCLKQTIFFGSLPEDVFKAVVARAEVVAVKQGEAFTRQGRPAEDVICVATGALKLTVAASGGREVVVDILESGSSFAEALLFREGPYPVSIIALKPSKVVAIPKSVIETELRAHPEAIPVILSEAYSHSHRLIRQVEHLKASTGLQRVADFLLTLAERHDTAVRFEIPYEKQTIASMLGIQPETLSRSFRRLSEHGVRIHGPFVEIRDRAALRRLLDEA